eukprot:CAMPEP_0179426510 /NCGR_PEP_ID=MMETSP0799-20121207/12784_1 /TAXON_ID=46947 /ORGANISM="Geminigera cryophila, Strain CCMP2564" /LENGTH=262 /DNA_ID=CAMNT_0021201281 /DNA_START=813 /DNA_END=1598 /DNA_ORIENTATION=+
MTGSLGGVLLALVQRPASTVNFIVHETAVAHGIESIFQLCPFWFAEPVLKLLEQTQGTPMVQFGHAILLENLLILIIFGIVLIIFASWIAPGLVDALQYVEKHRAPFRVVLIVFVMRIHASFRGQRGAQHHAVLAGSLVTIAFTKLAYVAPHRSTSAGHVRAHTIFSSQDATRGARLAGSLLNGLLEELLLDPECSTLEVTQVLSLLGVLLEPVIVVILAYQWQVRFAGAAMTYFAVRLLAVKQAGLIGANFEVRAMGAIDD